MRVRRCIGVGRMDAALDFVRPGSRVGLYPQDSKWPPATALLPVTDCSPGLTPSPLPAVGGWSHSALRARYVPHRACACPCLTRAARLLDLPPHCPALPRLHSYLQLLIGVCPLTSCYHRIQDNQLAYLSETLLDHVSLRVLQKYVADIELIKSPLI